VTAKLAAEELEVGKRYQVVFHDCCIQGHFVATLASMERDEEEVTSLIFENGVELDTFFAHAIDFLEEKRP
jgi:hypothetical protein